jgi:hypothetical protein
MDVEVKKCHRIQRQTHNETRNKKLEKKKNLLKEELTHFVMLMSKFATSFQKNTIT